MKDNELWELLKSAKTPERPEGYWRDFPVQVTSKLHRQQSSVPQRRMKPALVWGLALGTACVVIGLMFGRQGTRTEGSKGASAELAEARKCYREFEGMFPNQLQAIVFDRQGPRMVLADGAVVPDSTPFYLRVCGSAGCQGFVTFSGQEIQVGGELCEVLADGQGGVMLVGNGHVWSAGDSTSAVRVEARPLAM
jgi:hypothetical protein